jgi:D-tyrosyl-tRNA(Tyr) deacylase
MIAVVQRVDSSSVTARDADHRAVIGGGLCVLLGVEQGDTESDAAWIAAKIANLRVFRDEEGRMNRSIREIGGSVLVVSQFTLAGDCSKGNRPSFIGAAEPEIARPLYERVAERLRADHGLPVETGVFGASMLVSIENDGPVTLILRSPRSSDSG